MRGRNGAPFSGTAGSAEAQERQEMKAGTNDAVAGSTLVRARVDRVDPGGTLVVDDNEWMQVRLCDVLCGPGGTLPMFEGDSVLVWVSPDPEHRDVIIGRVLPVIDTPSDKSRVAAKHDELVLEARQTLILKCGDGSITIRKDGKILIKGKDLLSCAKRMNRIKGGAVSIN